MTKPNEIRQQLLTDERALFHARDLNIWLNLFAGALMEHMMTAAG